MAGKAHWLSRGSGRPGGRRRGQHPCIRPGVGGAREASQDSLRAAQLKSARTAGGPWVREPLLSAGAWATRSPAEAKARGVEKSPDPNAPWFTFWATRGSRRLRASGGPAATAPAAARGAEPAQRACRCPAMRPGPALGATGQRGGREHRGLLPPPLPPVAVAVTVAGPAEQGAQAAGRLAAPQHPQRLQQAAPPPSPHRRPHGHIPALVPRAAWPPLQLAGRSSFLRSPPLSKLGGLGGMLSAR